MNGNHFKIFIFFILISSQLFGQKSWTLQECITYALEHNLTLKDLNYNEKSNKESRSQSYRDLFPTISASSNYNVWYGRSVDPNTNEIISSDFYSNNYSIGAGIDIFNGFQKLNNIRATRFLHEAAKEETLQEKFLLAFRVMSAFYDVKYYEEQLKIVEEQLEISQTNVDLVKKQIELGIKAGADLYEAQSVFEGDRLAMVQSMNSLEAAKLSLLQEMNLTTSDSFEIDILEDDFMIEEETHKTITVDSVYNEALMFIPTIKAQEYKVQAAKKDIAMARGALYPSLSFSAGYSTGFYETNVDQTGKIIPFNTQIKDNASQYIAFNLNIPISSRWSRRSQIKQQKINLLRQNNTLELKKQELTKIIQKLVQDFVAALAEYEQTKQNTAAQSLAFTIAQKKYGKGMISILELNQAKNLLAKAQNENLQVVSKIKVLKKTIDFYKGLPVFTIENSN